MIGIAKQLIVKEFEKLLPKHKAGLYMNHNPHTTIYSTVNQYLEGYELKNPENWLSSEDMQKAIDTNELWRIQWYADTPVGFFVVLGSTLASAFAAIEKHS